MGSFIVRGQKQTIIHTQTRGVTKSSVCCRMLSEVGPLYMCRTIHVYTVPPSGNLTSARVSHACTMYVSHVRIFVRVRPATTRAHRTFAPRYVPFYHAFLMYMYEACARCKYFTVDKTSSIASLPLDRSYIHVRT